MMKTAENKTVYPMVIPKAHLVLGGMHVHIHGRRVHFQIQNKGWVTAVVEHVLIRFAHRVPYQSVFYGPAVAVKVLQIRLAAREIWQSDPPPQSQSIALAIQMQGVLHKRRAPHLNHPPILLPPAC